MMAGRMTTPSFRVISSGRAPQAAPLRSPPRRRTSRPALLLAALAALLGTACGETRHYSVDLQGNFTRVDEQGQPLEDQSLPRWKDEHEVAAGADKDGYAAGAYGAEAYATEDNAHEAGPQALPHALPAGGTDNGSQLVVVVDLKPGLGVDPSDFPALFVLARREGGRNGMPELVRRVETSQFPVRVELGARDSLTGTGVSGRYAITARLDSDGDAKAEYGDVQGISADMAQADGAPVLVVLNQVLDGSGFAPRPELGWTMPALAAVPAPAAHVHGENDGHDHAHGAAAPAAGSHVQGEDCEHDPPAAATAPRLAVRVELGADFAGQGDGTLFVILRSPQTPRGMPIAVRRVGNPRFPVELELGPDDVPLAVDNKGELLAGELVVSARLSRTGEAIGASGDLEAQPAPIRAGAAPVTVTLDRRRP